MAILTRRPFLPRASFALFSAIRHCFDRHSHDSRVYDPGWAGRLLRVHRYRSRHGRCRSNCQDSPGLFFGLYQRAGISRAGELFKRVLLFAVTGSVLTGILVLVIQTLGLTVGSFSRVIILLDMGLTAVFFWTHQVNVLGLTGCRFNC